MTAFVPKPEPMQSTDLISQHGAQPVRRQGSLHRRLPLLMSLLLVATVAVLGWVAYSEVENAVLEASHERLRGAARQLANLLVQSATQRMDESRRLAERSVFRLALDGDAQARAEARDMLNALVLSAPQMISAELWRGSTERLERAAQRPDTALDRTDAPAAPGFTLLEAAGPDVYFGVIVAVPARNDGSTATGAAADGYVVLRRRVSGANSAEVITRLLGEGVSLRFGSRRGGVWTDLSTVASAPPAMPPGAVTTYAADTGQLQLGIEEAVTGTPWSVWVAMPRQIALAPIRAFWRRMIPAALAVVFLGAIFAWLLSRRITTPLIEITHAAEAIAAGELGKRVRADRGDEIGRLAHAFDRMADRVEDGYARLDHGIRERTRELEDTLTALKDAQEQLVRREKLAMLGQLASGVGHELRNPLGVMTNAVYYLEMVQPEAETDVREYHGILRAQIGLAEKIVGDLLDFSRIKPPHRERVAVADLVDHQLARLTIAEGIDVHRAIARDLPRVHIDAVQVGQIVFNLLINALQAMEGRGGRVSLRATAVDGHVALDVEDDGPGVPRALRDKIFEPLFTTKARGIGLGLAVSRSLAEANGGRLRMSEGSRGGALFTLTMPIVSSEEAAA